MSKLIKVNCPTFYWLPKVNKRPYKSRFIQIQVVALLPFFLSILYLLISVKDHVIKYSESAFSNSNVKLFLVHWKVGNSSEVIGKLRLRLNFQGSQVSSFDVSTLYTSLPHGLIKAKMLSLVYGKPN